MIGSGKSSTARKRLPQAVCCVSLALLLPMAVPPLAAGRVEKRLAGRIAAPLLDELHALTAHPEYESQIPVIIKVKQDPGRRAETDGAPPQPNRLRSIDGYSARLTASQIRLLLQSEQIEYVTVDAVVRPTNVKGDPGSPTDHHAALKTTGIPLAHSENFRGAGVTVAVLDSGISDHPDLAQVARVKLTVDFTTGGVIEKDPKRVSIDNPDLYGHGTHVAGIIGGDGKKSSGYYSGVAPLADYVDLKVAGDDGEGRTSDLIRAIDWLLANKDLYNIRVANLSLGHPPVESYVNDPLCQAVTELVEAGVTTIVSAGNLGKTDLYPKIWGSVSSPGNHPAVITVSAVNTRGTATHLDDTATTYSSRGPTYIDGLFKPDLSAPGNAIASIYRSSGRLSTQYPELTLDGFYMMLSGSSMATAYVSGTAALMLAANPDLTPRMVKAILMLTASKLDLPHHLEQGNGLVNAYTAVKLAAALNMNTRTLKTEVAPTWELDGETIWAGGAFAYGTQIVYSGLVGPSGVGLHWGSGLDWSTHLEQNPAWADALFAAESALWDGQGVELDEVFWIDWTFWTEGLFWTDGIFWTEGILWTDGVIWTDGFFWTDNVGVHDYSGDQ